MKKVKQTLEKKIGKTLPEAQRTQGIEFMTCIVFFTLINLKLFQLKKIIQVLDSIPWVRCASGNVFLHSPLEAKRNIHCIPTAKMEGDSLSLYFCASCLTLAGFLLALNPCY